jgi:hypothetical protein
MLGTIITDSPVSCATTPEASRHPDKRPKTACLFINIANPHANLALHGQEKLPALLKQRLMTKMCHQSK